MSKLRPSPLVIVVFLLQFAVVIGSPAIVLIHHDMGWHLVTGETILATGQIPYSDPWSHSSGNFQWINLSWGWDVLAALAYGVGGLKLMLFLTGLISGLTSAVIVQHCIAKGANVLASLGVTFLLGIASLAYQLPDVAVAVAPQTMTLLYAALLHLSLSRIYRSRGAWAFGSVALLMLLWANTHGGFMVGLSMIGAYMLQAALARDKETATYFAGLFVVSALVVLVNPYGAGAFEGIARSIFKHPGSGISEWSPFPFGANVPAYVFLLMFIVFGSFRDKTIPFADRLLSFVWLFMGLSSRRHFAVFLIVSAPFLAVSVTSWFAARTAEPRRDRLGWLASVRDGRLLIVAAALALVAYVFVVPSNPEVPKRYFPREEIRYLAEHYRGRKLFNDWNLGGYIIFETRGELPIFIDGRADTAYPPEVTSDYFALARYENWDETLARYGFEVAIIPNYRNSMLFYFRTNPAWKVGHQGENATIFVREDPLTG